MIGHVCKLMQVHRDINIHYVLSLLAQLVTETDMHAQTLILRGPCVSSQTVKRSVSMPRQSVPSALGFVMTCTGISVMLDLCAEPARIPSRSTNTFPGYPSAEKSLKVCKLDYLLS